MRSFSLVLHYWAAACMMRPIATGDPVARCVSVSICLSRGTAERIYVVFWVKTSGKQRHIVFDRSPDPLTTMGKRGSKVLPIVNYMSIARL